MRLLRFARNDKKGNVMAKNNHNRRMAVDLGKAERLSCKSCKSARFIPAWEIRRLSAIMSPDGKEHYIDIQVWVCLKCGADLTKPSVDGVMREAGKDITDQGTGDGN